MKAILFVCFATTSTSSRSRTGLLSNKPAKNKRMDDYSNYTANYAARDVITLIYPIISLFDVKAYFMHFLNMYGFKGLSCKE